VVRKLLIISKLWIEANSLYLYSLVHGIGITPLVLLKVRMVISVSYERWGLWSCVTCYGRGHYESARLYTKRLLNSVISVIDTRYSHAKRLWQIHCGLARAHSAL
jgi:hypothetical protein